MPSACPELDDAAYAKRKEMLEQGDRLADHPFFAFWVFNPRNTMEAVGSSPLPAGNALTDQQYRPLVRELLDEDTREAMRQSLRGQAWLLNETGDEAARDQALAVAAQLASGRLAGLVKQPFMRALVERSVFDARDTVFGDDEDREAESDEEE